MLRNLRRLYWLLSAFLKKYLVRILAVTGLTVFVFIALPQLIRRIPSGKPHTKIARIGQFTVRQLPLDIQRLISLGLTDLAADGTATPSLALRWEVKDAGQRYIFHLDDTVVWQDGQPFQAADVTYALKDIEQNITDSQTLEFKLKEPFAPFPQVLSTPLFRRSSTLSRIFKRPKSELIGTGEYQVNGVKQRGQFIEILDLESPEKKITYRFYTTEQAAILGFKLGEVDTIENLTDPAPLADWPNVNIEEIPHLNRYVAVFFNTQDPNLADKNLRQALTYAIPEKGGEQRALGPIHPESWVYNPQVKEYATSQSRAKELLAEFAEEGEAVNLTIRLDTTLAYLDLAEKIKAAWEPLGITTEIRVINFLPQEYQALLAVHQIPPDPDQYTLWHSTQATNLTKIQSPKIDKLLEDGRTTIDRTERKEIYQDFQRFLLEESPAAFLFYQTTHTVSRK